MIRSMTGDDFEWAAQLMQRRRERYAEYSPVFWRPAADVVAAHAAFLELSAGGPGAVAVRSDHGFVIATTDGDRMVIDDFAVDADELWRSDGRALLAAVGEHTAASGGVGVRVVCARLDEPKRSMLSGAGLEVAARWWVKELAPSAAPGAIGATTLDGVEVQLVSAPPVYDPGGPVFLLGDIDPHRAIRAADTAAGVGAVLAIVQREPDTGSPPETEVELEAAGFHNPSEFYDGWPR